MEVIKFQTNLVQVRDGNIKAWIDVWIENDNLICDWNQNDFIITDPKDMNLKKWQDNIDNFETASALAIKTLNEAGFISQDENGKWYRNINRMIKPMDN